MSEESSCQQEEGLIINQEEMCHDAVSLALVESFSFGMVPKKF